MNLTGKLNIGDKIRCSFVHHKQENILTLNKIYEVIKIKKQYRGGDIDVFWIKDNNGNEKRYASKQCNFDCK